MRDESKFSKPNGSNTVNYSGKMSEYHTNGERYYNKPLTHHQKKLYEQTVFGISVLTKEETEKLTQEQKQEIIDKHKLTQELLNTWKQEIVNELSNHLFKVLFPNAPFTKTLTEKYPDVIDKGYTNTIPFKLLKIKRHDIIRKLMKSGILPQDFYGNNSKPIKTKLA